ncbi:MAG: hypothetical protein QOI24_1220 [Acidobacteriota bacterium]|jgi:hypothetical protein|nr:hypothetical protein [Acidobacteriota bacterium]
MVNNVLHNGVSRRVAEMKLDARALDTDGVEF